MKSTKVCPQATSRQTHADRRSNRADIQLRRFVPRPVPGRRCFKVSQPGERPFSHALLQGQTLSNLALRGSTRDDPVHIPYSNFFASTKGCVISTNSMRSCSRPGFYPRPHRLRHPKRRPSRTLTHTDAHTHTSIQMPCYHTSTPSSRQPCGNSKTRPG